MAKAQRIVCDMCPAGRIDVGAPFCLECGHPTRWATHDDRVQWEVGQWRRARGGSEGNRVAQQAPVGVARPLASVSTLPAQRDPERKTSVIFVDAPSTAGLTAANRLSLFERFFALIGHLRRLFGRSIVLSLDDAPAGPTLVAAEPLPEPVVIVEEPVTEPEPEPVAVADPIETAPVAEAPAPIIEIGNPAPVETPAPPVAALPSPEPSPEIAPVETVSVAPKPRKRPQRPTNKDMLKRALQVLTKVEERLEHLEVEVAEIDEAVRAPRAMPIADGGDDLEQLPL